jgi:hypothetical protein
VIPAAARLIPSAIVVIRFEEPVTRSATMAIRAEELVIPLAGIVIRTAIPVIRSAPYRFAVQHPGTSWGIPPTAPSVTTP